MRIIGERPYSICCVETGHVLTRDSGAPMSFAYRKTALAQLESLQKLGRRVKISVDVGPAAQEAWRNREKKFIKSGPKFTQEAFYLSSPYGDLHFPRHSVNFPGKIAFTASEEDGFNNKQTVISIRKYLDRFFETLTMSEKERIAASFAEEASRSEIHFAYTAEEIHRVYESGPSSCMSYKAKNEFNSKIHPACMYAGGDLAVAYLVNARGKISARAVCYPANKVYVSIYGDEGRMHLALKAAGFSQTYDTEKFLGARITAFSAKRNKLAGSTHPRSFTATVMLKTEKDIEKYLAFEGLPPDHKILCGSTVSLRVIVPYLDGPLGRCMNINYELTSNGLTNFEINHDGSGLIGNI